MFFKWLKSLLNAGVFLLPAILLGGCIGVLALNLSNQRRENERLAARLAETHKLVKDLQAENSGVRDADAKLTRQLLTAWQEVADLKAQTEPGLLLYCDAHGWRTVWYDSQDCPVFRRCGYTYKLKQ